MLRLHGLELKRQTSSSLLLCHLGAQLQLLLEYVQSALHIQLEVIQTLVRIHGAEAAPD